MVDKTRIAAAGAGVAALAGLTAAVKVWRDRRGDAQNPAVVRLKPADDEWIMQIEGVGEGDVRFATKRVAVRESRVFAREHAPSRLIIHRQDGTVQREHAYEAG